MVMQYCLCAGVSKHRADAGSSEVNQETTLMSSIHASRFRGAFLQKKMAQQKQAEAEAAAAAWHKQHAEEQEAQGALSLHRHMRTQISFVGYSSWGSVADEVRGRGHN